MTMLYNKKVMRTQTISNATVHVESISNGSTHQHGSSPTTHAKIVLWRYVFITDQATSMMICENHHRISSMTRLLWWTGFHHRFVIKLKLWRIWLLQWWNLIVIEVDIPISGSPALVLSKEWICVEASFGYWIDVIPWESEGSDNNTKFNRLMHELMMHRRKIYGRELDAARAYAN